MVLSNIRPFVLSTLAFALVAQEPSTGFAAQKEESSASEALSSNRSKMRVESMPPQGWVRQSADSAPEPVEPSEANQLTVGVELLANTIADGEGQAYIVENTTDQEIWVSFRAYDKHFPDVDRGRISFKVPAGATRRESLTFVEPAPEGHDASQGLHWVPMTTDVEVTFQESTPLTVSITRDHIFAVPLTSELQGLIEDSRVSTKCDSSSCTATNNEGGRTGGTHGHSGPHD